MLSTNPEIQVKIKGDNSLNKRNMDKLINLMSEFGTTFLPKNKSNFPLTLISSEIPIGIEYKAGVSAQLKSAVMLAGLNANGVTNIMKRKKVEIILRICFYKLQKLLEIKKNKKKQNLIKVYGKGYLDALKINVGETQARLLFLRLNIAYTKR